MPWRHIAVLAVMAILVLIAYVNSFHVPFLFDDVDNIARNISIHFSDLSLERVKELIGQNYHKSIRIFAFLTFALNYYFGGLNVFGYHLVNLLIHLSSGALLYRFLLLTFTLPLFKERYGTRALFIAFFSSLIFLTHPIQTQAVTYIVQRMASMGGMFFLLGMVLYVQGRLSSGKKRFLYWVAMVLSYPFGLFTKENVAILPVFIALYEFYFFQNLALTSEGKKTFICLSGAVLSIGLIMLYIWGGRYYDVILEGYKIRNFTLTERVLTQFRVVLYYLTLLSYPAPSRFKVDHDFPVSRGLLDPWTTISSILIVGVIIGYSILAAKKRPLLSYFVIWYFGNLLIESSIFPLEMVFEHRLYLPMVGPAVLFVLGMGWGWDWLKERCKIRDTRQSPLWVFLSFLVCFLVVACYQRNLIWRDETVFWRDVNTKSPNKPRPLNNLGAAFLHVGRHEEAIKVLKRAISIKPDYADAWTNLGAALIDAGRPTEARLVLERAILINPDYPEAYFNLGNIYFKNLRDNDAAISFFTKAITLKPDYVNAYANLGVVFSHMQRYEEAITVLKRAKSIKPDYVEIHNNLGAVLIDAGREEEAKQVLEEAIRVNPDYPEAYFNLGNIYFTHLRDNNGAIPLFAKAIMLKPDYVNAYVSLAAAYNGMRRYNETLRLLTGIQEKIAYRADGHFNLGVAYAGLGNFAAARREVEIVRQMNFQMALQLEKLISQSQAK